MRTLLVILLLTTAAFAQDYNRADYGGWIDADGDCLDTREEVLVAESLIPVTVYDCKVTYGLWVCPYTGEATSDPSELHVDHFVPLSEAHKSGAAEWPAEKKIAYGNDLDHPEHLVAVMAAANLSKRDYDPAVWMPPNRAFWEEYLKAWTGIKERWGLAMDAAECEAICRLQELAPEYAVGDFQN